MTREEAISELQKAIDLIKQNGKDWLDERDIPILQMAITALELSDSIMLQLDCKMFHSGVNVDNTVSDETTDIIYRQAAIDAIRNNVFAVTPTQIDTKIDCMESVEAVPSAQPEIIRCQNCKHFIGLLDEKSAKKYGQEYECECGRLNKPEPDDFCSRAERRTDGVDS